MMCVVAVGSACGGEPGLGAGTAASTGLGDPVVLAPGGEMSPLRTSTSKRTGFADDTGRAVWLTGMAHGGDDGKPYGCR